MPALGDDGVTQRVINFDYAEGRVVGSGGGPATELFTTMPGGGIALGDAFLGTQGQSIATLGEPLVLLRAQAGPSGQLGRDGVRWVWAVDFASDDGYFSYRAYVDFLSGAFLGSTGGSVTGEGALP